MSATDTTVRGAMTAAPTCVPLEASVVEAARVMAGERVGALPVLSEGRLVGIVTDRDLVVQVLAEGIDGRQVLVSDVCTDDPITVTPEEPVAKARRLMAEKRVRRLPVVEDGRLVGIVAQADVARVGQSEETGEMVREISRESVRRR